MVRELSEWLRRRRPRVLPPREAYALWAARYPPWAHNALMRVEQSTVESMLASAAPARALDVGTGSGRYLPVLASTGARLVAGVDFSMPMLRRHTTSRPRVCAEAGRLPFRDECVDLVTSALMLGDIADLGQCIREFARVLRPNGHLVYSDFHPAWAAGRWRRTFEGADGRTVELAYYAHAIEDHLSCLEANTFDVVALREPTLAESPAGAYVPVLAIFHAVRRS